MAVVINEFEVVPLVSTPSPVKQRGEGESSSGGEQAKPPTSQEIERALQQQWERAERVRAH